MTHQFQVPIIAVFTKHDQFLRNVAIDLEDYGNPFSNTVSEEAEGQYKEHYLRHLGDGARFLRLGSPFVVKCAGPYANPLVKEMHKPETRCHSLLRETVNALNEDAVALMLWTVQRKDLKLSITVAVER